MYCVPLYDSLGENAIEFIIHQAEVSLVCAAGDKMPQLVKAIPMIKDTLKVVVYWGTADAASIQVGLIWHTGSSVPVVDSPLAGHLRQGPAGCSCPRGHAQPKLL